MMRSMYSAVSGLNIHQTKMDVIGNNIANVNTVGFKGSNVTFQEVFSQTVKGAGSPTEGKGGTNPQQIGLGASMGSITVNHGKGSTERTDRTTDLMIDGNGFFMVSDDPNAQNRYYTRAGNFDVDEEGNLVNAQGMKVLDEDMKPIVINKSATKKATQSTGLYLDGNINVNHGEDPTDDPISTTVDVYDSLGDIHTLNVEFDGKALGYKVDPNTLDGNLDGDISKLDPRYGSYDDTDVAQGYSLKKMNISPQEGSFNTSMPNDVYALFNEEGQIVDLVNATVDTSTDPIGVSGVSSYSTEHIKSLNRANDLKFEIDRSIFFKQGNAANERSLTQYSKETDAKAAEVEGNAAGSINSFNISQNGEVNAVYTNGESNTLATIALASFDNPAGLQKVGGNLFKDTVNSGTAKVGQPSTGSFGSLNPGALEMSNVDLSKEFTKMITTQRGFQANSRVISTSDEILQELVNLKR